MDIAKSPLICRSKKNIVGFWLPLTSFNNEKENPLSLLNDKKFDLSFNIDNLKVLLYFF